MRRRHRQLLADAATYVLLTLASLAILLPILWVLRTSLTTRVIAYQIPPQWVITPTLDNYRAIFGNLPFGRYFFNSSYVAVVTTVLALLIGAPAAYAIARFRVGGLTTQVGIMASQMLPPIVLVVPIFVLMKSLDMINSLTALIITYLSFNLPYVIWFLTGFMDGVPEELEEAARVDGATRGQAFRKVVVPLLAPGLMSVAVLSFILSWNEFLFALVLSGTDSRTLPMALANLETHRGVAIAELSAATIVVILPVVFLSFFIQRYLVRGLTFGAIK